MKIHDNFFAWFAARIWMCWLESKLIARPIHQRASAMGVGIAIGAACLALSISAVGQAQLRREIGHLSLPAISPAATDSALTVELNPAALGTLPSWSLVYTHVDARDGATLMEKGDGFFAATPLIWGLGVGASVQSMRPTDAATGADRTIGTLGLGFSPRQSFGIGANLRFVGANDPVLGGIVSTDVAALWRPIDWLSLSLMGRELTAPRDLPRSMWMDAAIRPFGTDWVTVGFGGAIDDRKNVGSRANLGVTIPYVGRFLGGFEVDRMGDANPLWRFTTGLELQWNQAALAGGLIGGDGFGPGPGWYVMGRLEGVTRPGLPLPGYVWDLEVKSELGTRTFLPLLVRLDRALSNPQVKGVYLRLRGTDMPMAFAQELREINRMLAQRGKKVICHLDAASGNEYYACAGAAKVLIDPAGGIRMSGVAMSSMRFGELFYNVGVRADFVRIGKYKAAAEQYQNWQMSEEAKLSSNELLDDLYARLTKDLAGDWKISVDKAKQRLNQGPFISEEAKEAQLVDALVDETQIQEEGFEPVFSKKTRMRTSLNERAPHRWGVASRVGVVVVDEMIVDGENVDIPILDIHLTGGRTIVKSIESMAADPTIRAIVLRLDTPGGSALASDQIWRAVRRAKEHKPVIASMGQVAASGGYYIASAADEIWADPSTITGSIGVLFGKVDLEPLATKIGVSIDTFHRGNNAGAESLWRPFSESERLMLSQKVRAWYRQFIRRVSIGRGMSEKQVDALARGRVWSGDKARCNGLVDRLGGFVATLMRARQVSGLDDRSQVVIRPERPQELLDYILGGQRTEVQANQGLGALSPELVQALSYAVMLQRSSLAAPAAVLPWILQAP